MINYLKNGGVTTKSNRLIIILVTCIFLTTTILVFHTASAFEKANTIDLTHTLKEGNFSTITTMKSQANNMSVTSDMIRAMSSETNLVYNGDFLSGDPSTSGWPLFSDPARGIPTFTWDWNVYRSGGRSLKIEGTSIFAFSSHYDVPIQSDKRYAFSAWGKAINITRGNNDLGSFIFVQQLDNNGEPISGTEQLFASDGTFDWDEAKLTFVADSNAAYMSIILGLNGSGTVWYDDIYLVEAPVQTESMLLPKSALITDTVMHPSYPILYALDKVNLKLYAINYEDKRINEISFNLQPERIDYNNGKLYVTLLKAPHNSQTMEGQQSGAIAVVDTMSLSLIKQIEVATDPFDVVVSGDYIYIPSGSGQWTRIKSYSVTSKQLVSSWMIRQQSYAELNPVLNKIYTVTTDSIPRDITVYDISQGTFTRSYDSPYHGDYPMRTNFRVSPDGRYIFNGSGLILTCNAEVNKDLRFVSMLSKKFNDVAFDLKNNKFYIAVPGKVNYSYKYDSLERINTFGSQGEVLNLYYREGKLIALSKTNSGQFIVERIDIPGVLGKVDLSRAVESYGLSYGDTGYNMNYDLNSDGIIDLFDLVTIGRHLEQ